MNETKITVCKMIIQMIMGNQLTLDEELDIKKALMEREETRKAHCLAGIIEKELDELTKMGKLNESIRQKY